jgi:hypothetical protein
MHFHVGFTADAKIAGMGSSITPWWVKFVADSRAAVRIASSASLDWARSIALILTPPLKMASNSSSGASNRQT